MGINSAVLWCLAFTLFAILFVQLSDVIKQLSDLRELLEKEYVTRPEVDAYIEIHYDEHQKKMYKGE